MVGGAEVMAQAVDECARAAHDALLQLIPPGGDLPTEALEVVEGDQFGGDGWRDSDGFVGEEGVASLFVGCSGWGGEGVLHLCNALLRVALFRAGPQAARQIGRLGLFVCCFLRVCVFDRQTDKQKTPGAPIWRAHLPSLALLGLVPAGQL